MKRLFVFGLLLLPMAASAQHQIRAAYFGETITHYGLKLAYDRPVFHRAFTNKRGNAIQHQFLVGGGIAFFRHPHQQKGLLLSPEVTWRRIGKRGGLFDVALSPAFFRYFYEGSTYEYVDGHFRKITLAGRNAFLPTLSVGGGRDLAVSKNLPLMWYYRVHLMRQYPYNASTLTRFALEVGIVHTF